MKSPPQLAFRHRLVDRNDSLLARAVPYGLTALATLGALALWLDVFSTGHFRFMTLDEVLIMSLAGPFMGYFVWRHHAESKLAEAGVLELERWPLPAGKKVMVRYRRRLRAGEAGGHVAGYLVFECKQGDFHNPITLKQPRVEFTGPEACVTWHMKVPRAKDEHPGSWKLHIHWAYAVADALVSDFPLAVKG